MTKKVGEKNSWDFNWEIFGGPYNPRSRDRILLQLANINLKTIIL